jgi:hypothetical protein
MIQRLSAILSGALFLGLALLHAGDSGIGSISAINADGKPAVGGSYYLRYCLKCEHGTHETTNYWTGTLVPINTKVVLVSLASRKMVLRVEQTGKEFTVENVEKYSRRNMDLVVRNLLAQTPVPLGEFEERIANSIRDGQPLIGMTKEQVIMSRGYPPGHKTPTLDSDIWIYWITRLTFVTYAFENGILTSGARLSDGPR